MSLEIAILVNKQHNEDQVGLGYKTKSPNLWLAHGILVKSIKQKWKG